MIAVEYKCGCGEIGKLVKYTPSEADCDYPNEQYYISCDHCGTRTFRFDSPQASEADWAGMDGNQVAYADKRVRVA